MRALFPSTPNLRYERMALAAAAALWFAFLGLSFVTPCLEAWAAVGPLALWSLQAASVRAVTLGTWTAGAFLLALAFGCFTLIKLSVPGWPGYQAWKPGLRRLGLQAVRLAVSLVCLSLVWQAWAVWAA